MGEFKAFLDKHIHTHVHRGVLTGTFLSSLSAQYKIHDLNEPTDGCQFHTLTCFFWTLCSSVHAFHCASPASLQVLELEKVILSGLKAGMTNKEFFSIYSEPKKTAARIIQSIEVVLPWHVWHNISDTFSTDRQKKTTGWRYNDTQWPFGPGD